MRFLFVLVALVLSACAVTYNFNGFSYDTPQAALQAQQKLIDERIQLIMPTDDPIGGRALAVVFDRETIRSVMTITGQASAETRSYFLDSIEKNALALKPGMERTGLFDSVDLLRAPELPDVAPGYDYIVGQVTKDSTESAVINTATGARATFDLDPNAAEIDRQVSFAAAMERAARKVASE